MINSLIKLKSINTGSYYAPQNVPAELICAICGLLVLNDFHVDMLKKLGFKIEIDSELQESETLVAYY